MNFNFVLQTDKSTPKSFGCKLSLLFQGNWFGPAVINQIEAFVPGGGTSHMKGVGMLVVSLRGVDFGFWSHLGCSGQNTIIFSREGLV